MSIKKIHFPTIPLQEMIARQGGIARDQAIDAAMANVKSISGEGDQIIEVTIQALEALVAGVHGEALSPDQLREILVQADQIVTMAGTFGYGTLDKATRGLCDIADGLMHAGMGDVAPVAVHIRAMRLFSPFCAAPQADVSDHILDELAKVAAHYNFPSLDTEG